AERERAVLELARHGEEELATDAGDDRDDHDRQHDAGDEDAARARIATEERNEPERVVEPWLDVVRPERAEDEDPPEAEHHARYGGEHLDERDDDALHPWRRELREEECDRDPERAGDQERHRGGDGGAVEERPRAEDALVVVPDGVPEETQP